MKRICMMIAVLLCGVCAMAQDDDVRGLQHNVDLKAEGMMETVLLSGEYTLGWRFNNLLFLGGGIGYRHHIYFGMNSEGQYSKASEFQQLYNKSGEPVNRYKYTGDGNIAVIRRVTDPLPFDIPVFANVRLYLMKTRLAPYLSASAGARFSKDYVRPYASAAVGGRYRTRNNKELTLTFFVSYPEKYTCATPYTSYGETVYLPDGSSFNKEEWGYRMNDSVELSGGFSFGISF